MGRPVITLILTGLTYAVLSTVLSGIASPLLTGHLQGPLATPAALVPVLVGGAFSGIVLTGLLAWGVLKGAGPDATLPLGPAMGVLTPGLAVAGAVTVLALDRRRQRRSPSHREPDPAHDSWST